jgi:hypothetical protein
MTLLSPFLTLLTTLFTTFLSALLPVLWATIPTTILSTILPTWLSIRSTILLIALMRPVLLRMVLLRSIATHVVLIIHMLRILLRLVLGALLVKPVLALRLGKLVDLCAGESSEEFLCELMGDRLAWRTAEASQLLLK